MVRTSARPFSFLVATFFVPRLASAQLFQWTPEQLTKYTAKNPYQRFPDGRPKVPDDMLDRMKGLIAEEVLAAMPARDFPNQFTLATAGGAGADEKMVGRVFT